MVQEVVRSLRKHQTEAEALVWEKIRNRQLAGAKFVRQYPIKVIIDNQKRYFIADFYCPEHRLVIELDGGIHEKRKDYDRLRDRLIKEKGINVLRFNNDKVYNHLFNVLKSIENLILSPLSARRDREGI